MGIKKRVEFSKIVTVGSIVLGNCWITASYVLAFLGREVNEAVTVAVISQVMVVPLGYFLYQYKLKDSRNEHRVDKDGNPYNTISNKIL